MDKHLDYNGFHLIGEEDIAYFYQPFDPGRPTNTQSGKMKLKKTTKVIIFFNNHLNYKLNYIAIFLSDV